MELISVDPALLAKWNRPVPRYTSYPTAPQFYPVDEKTYRERLEKIKSPVSVYIHIPFCKTMCLFCACSVVLNRKPEKQKAYLEMLFKEIELLPFQRKEMAQLHLGGGTPTSLTEEEFELLMQKLKTRFVWEKGAELSIEIDPRTVWADRGKKLKALKRLGFNRVSFGVQDLDPKVQEAVRRRQSEEMTKVTYAMAREIGFEGINLDLIYGLPYQTAEQFAKTAEEILKMRPDRIAFFSYAKVPWLKPHQKAIADETLPSHEEKFQIYVETRKKFMNRGYEAIGMDHFSVPEDPLMRAYREKRLMRNFQGYSIKLAEDMIGLGVTSIGFVGGGYFQNEKTIETYKASLGKKSLPVQRGYLLTKEDALRRWVIQSLMCHFEVDKREFAKIFGKDFDEHFAKERDKIKTLKEENLLEETSTHIIPTPLGRLFIRLIAAAFDAHLKEGGYSKAV